MYAQMSNTSYSNNRKTRPCMCVISMWLELVQKKTVHYERNGEDDKNALEDYLAVWACTIVQPASCYVLPSLPSIHIRSPAQSV